MVVCSINGDLRKFHHINRKGGMKTTFKNIKISKKKLCKFHAILAEKKEQTLSLIFENLSFVNGILYKII